MHLLGVILDSGNAAENKTDKSLWPYDALFYNEEGKQ